MSAYFGIQEFEKFGLELVSHRFLAHLELRPALSDQIKEAQKGHESIEGIKSRLKKQEVKGFKVDSNGILWFDGRICVPNVPDHKQLIMKKAHEYKYSIHPGGTKMYQDLKEQY